MTLSPEQQKSYRDNGFYFPIHVMRAGAAASHIDRLEAIEKTHGPMHYRIKPYLIVRSAWEIGIHPVLLDAVESVLGPDILLWDSAYVIKEPHTDNFVSWHQDLTYWGLEMESDYDLVSAWVALTPATAANGAMRFVRGSHTQGRYRHDDSYEEQNILHRGQTIADEFADSMIMQTELVAGQASLHQGWTVHASGPNVSNTRRVGIVFNYLKPNVRQIVGDYETATLVRGEDRYGNFRPEPACESDFAPANVAFQLEVERKKHEVYDTA